MRVRTPFPNSITCQSFDSTGHGPECVCCFVALSLWNTTIHGKSWERDNFEFISQEGQLSCHNNVTVTCLFFSWKIETWKQMTPPSTYFQWTLFQIQRIRVLKLIKSKLMYLMICHRTRHAHLIVIAVPWKNNHYDRRVLPWQELRSCYLWGSLSRSSSQLGWASFGPETAYKRVVIIWRYFHT